MAQVKSIELIIHFEDGRVFNMDTSDMSACEETLKSLSGEEQQIIENYLGAFE